MRTDNHLCTLFRFFSGEQRPGTRNFKRVDWLGGVSNNQYATGQATDTFWGRRRGRGRTGTGRTVLDKYLSIIEHALEGTFTRGDYRYASIWG